jgi:hypothetical protein
MSIVLVILLILLLFGGIGTAPTWGYSRGWGWGQAASLVFCSLCFSCFC